MTLMLKVMLIRAENFFKLDINNALHIDINIRLKKKNFIASRFSPDKRKLP